MNRTTRIVHHLCGLAVAAGLTSTPACAGGVEQFISFQGRLTGSDGKPISDDLHVLDFFIYDAESGGTLIGSVVDVTVFVSGGNGVVSTPFGPVDPSWFAGSPRYLGLTVDDTDDIPEGQELGRIQLTAVPSALMAWGLAPGILLNVDDASIKDTLAVANAIGIGLPATPGIPLYIRQSAGGAPIVAGFEATAGENNINFSGVGNVAHDSGSVRLNFSNAGVVTNSMAVLASGKIVFSGNGQTPYGNISFTNDGRIGIGTESPEYKLHVYQTAPPGGSAGNATFETAGGINFLSFRGSGIIGDGWSTVFGFYNEGQFTTAMNVTASGKFVFSDGQSDGRVVITPDGRLGIGNEAPQAPIHVVTTGTSTTQARFQNTQGVSNVEFFSAAPPGNNWSTRLNFYNNYAFTTSMSVTSNGKFIFSDVSTPYGNLTITPTGKLGIGEENPVAAFHARSAGGAAGENTATFVSPGCGPWASHVHFGPKGDWYIRSANATGKLVLQDAGGNVGIGTASPQSHLDVNGTTRTKVLQITGGADVAEPFRISGADGSASSVLPGMVVVIDPDRPGDLRVATEPLDRRVAGVVSGANGIAPGMVLRSEGDSAADGPHPVALTGRVWCWCDAASGPIRAGDRLTTSSTAGHAMRVSDDMRADGTVIGKAMSELPAGRGLVLVLVNLQ